ncbi:MAG TPA: DUF4390 domain-containing protein [Steroidobacteraceae bacterium]|jgi:hypothetical protein|nr:DUF4390 domain-containing protein [Steroidobacteraceae bacterium]
MLRGDPAKDGLIRAGFLAAGSLIALLAASGLPADALDGVLEVHSAYVNIDRGVFLLHARVEYPVSPAIGIALRDGVTLTFDLEARVERERRLWFNSNIVEVTLRRDLSYHAVTDRYVVRDVRSGDQNSFATLEDALDFLGKVNDWPILVEPQLDEGNYTISVRAGVRRGSLPASLRALLFWTNDWARVSEWYTWSLPM